MQRPATRSRLRPRAVMPCGTALAGPGYFATGGGVHDIAVPDGDALQCATWLLVLGKVRPFAFVLFDIP